MQLNHPSFAETLIDLSLKEIDVLDNSIVHMRNSNEVALIIMTIVIAFCFNLSVNISSKRSRERTSECIKPLSYLTRIWLWYLRNILYSTYLSFFTYF